MLGTLPNWRGIGLQGTDTICKQKEKKVSGRYNLSTHMYTEAISASFGNNRRQQ